VPRFAANLSTLYGEHAFLDRFGAAAADGFDAVECQFPYAHAAPDIAAALARHDLVQVLFNLPAGDFAAGERGLAALPGREDEFAASLAQALPYALATGCRRLHALAGIVRPGADRAAMRATYVANLRRAAAQLSPHGIELLIEPINTRDMPGYFLTLQAQAHEIVAEVGAPNLRVQMDLYHCQIMEGDLTTLLRRHLGGSARRIGHIQIAGVPDRREPHEGELALDHLMTLLDDLGYDGFVGCEYHPRAGTSAGLSWLRRWREAHTRDGRSAMTRVI